MKITLRSLFVILLFLSILFLTLRPVTDPDFWWHLKTGQLILENGNIPHSDPYSFTAQGAPWIAHEWLSEVLIYSFYSIGKIPLLIIVFSLLITIAFIFTYLRTSLISRPYISGFIILLAALSTAPTWGVRPQMITLFFSSIFLFILDRFHQTHNWKYLLCLPCIMLFWVNMHAGYFLGLVILLLYLSGAAIDYLWYRLKRKEHSNYPQIFSMVLFLSGALLACLVIAIINPNGIKILAYPFQTLTSPSMQQFIQEWYSPDFHKIEWQPFLIFILILILIGIIKRKNFSTAQLLLGILLGFSALHSMRNIPLFVITLTPILADQVSSFIYIPVSEFKPGKSSYFIFPLVILLFMFGIGMRSYQTIKAQPFEEEMVFPKQAVDWISVNRPAGALFNSYDWGGYLIWRLFPNYKVFIDGRADVYGDKFLSEYSKIYLFGKQWEDKFNKYNIKLVLIDKSSILAEEINENTDWKVLFMDDKSVLYGLNSP